MFISPALEELIEPSSGTASGERRPLPSSIHDPPSMDEYDSRTGPDSNRSASSSEIDTFQRDLARHLAGVDEQTFQKVKQAIQTVLNQRQESTHQQSLIEVCHTLMVGHASYPYCLKPQGFEATGRTRGLCAVVCRVSMSLCHNYCLSCHSPENASCRVPRSVCSKLCMGLP